MYICIYTNIDEFVSSCVRAAPVYVYTYVYIYIHTNISHVYTCRYIYTYVYMYICVYVNMYTCIYVYVYNVYCALCSRARLSCNGLAANTLKHIATHCNKYLHFVFACAAFL